MRINAEEAKELLLNSGDNDFKQVVEKALEEISSLIEEAAKNSLSYIVIDDKLLTKHAPFIAGIFILTKLNLLFVAN